MIASKLITAQLILTIIIASQGIFYLVGAAQAYQKLSVAAFSEQRLVLDGVIAVRLKILYFLALITGICTLTVLRREPLTVPFICITVATLLLLADVLVAFAVNIPINKALAQVPLTGPGNAAALQFRWLHAMVVRGMLSSLALASLLIAWANR